MKPAEALALVVGVPVVVIAWPAWAVVNAWRVRRFRRAVALPRADVDPATVSRARWLVQTELSMASGAEELGVLEVWTDRARGLPDTDPAFRSLLAAVQARGLALRPVSGGTVGGVGQALVAPLSLLFWGIVLAVVVLRDS